MHEHHYHHDKQIKVPSNKDFTKFMRHMEKVTFGLYDCTLIIVVTREEKQVNIFSNPSEMHVRRLR